MAVLSGPDPGEAEREKQMDLLVDSLVQCCQYAQDKATDTPVWITLESPPIGEIVGPATLRRFLRDAGEIDEPAPASAQTAVT